MPATIHKIDSSAAVYSDVSSHLHSVRRKVIPFAPETRFLPERRPGETAPYCRRHEMATALLLTVGLHLAGFALLQGDAHEEALTEPAPIQVAWIAAPHPHAESTPASPAKPQKPRKPALKPKPKAAKRIKAKPKAVLSSSAAVPAAATVPSESAEKTATGAATAPVTNTAQPVSSASSPENADSRQPLVQPNLNADYLNNPAPHYPEKARERGEEGKVLIKSLINADGTVAKLAIKKSSGFPDLDRSALETVKKWRFVPARRGDTNVSAWVVVPVSFTLEG
jgi:protein TonB